MYPNSPEGNPGEGRGPEMPRASRAAWWLLKLAELLAHLVVAGLIHRLG